MEENKKMSTPSKGVNATIKLATTAVGYAKNCKIGINGNLIKEYAIDQGNTPAMLEQGNLSFPVSIEALFIDSTHANQVLAGTPIDLEVKPKSGGTYTVNAVVLSNWELSVTQEGAVLQKVSGEGKSISIT